MVKISLWVPVDSTKWDKAWFWHLPMVYKLFWVYICDRCDYAGVWDVNASLAEHQLHTDAERLAYETMSYDLEKALEHFGDRVIPFDDGKKWFIPKFITFQYGVLDPDKPVHKNVLKKLQTRGVPQGAVQGVRTPQEKAKAKAKAKVNKLDVGFLLWKQAVNKPAEQFKNVNTGVNVKVEYDKFIDYVKSSGKQYKDYSAAFRNWLRRVKPTETNEKKEYTFGCSVQEHGVVKGDSPDLYSLCNTCKPAVKRHRI